jgi:hypothetical protein
MMKVTENPVQPGTLTRLRQLTEGHKGVLFVLENKESHKLVVILMEYAEGTMLLEVRKHRVEEFLRVLCEPTFQMELGKIVAADTFAGNPDRMFAAKVGPVPGQPREGWYHEQNLFVSKGGKPVAIDNAFTPWVHPATLPWGRYLGNAAIQWGSIASACITYAQEEARLLFAKFLATVAKDHPGKRDAIEGVREQHQAAFVVNFSRAATQTMQALLIRGQRWKKSLTECGAEEKILKAFRVRVRVLRQVSHGVDPTTAAERAENDAEYRKWVLTSEFGLEVEEADELLKKGHREYKKFKALTRRSSTPAT